MKFRRQVKLGPYIVDFVCFDKNMIVEIDGGQHNGNERDNIRDAYFKDRGYVVKRYWNNDVLNNIEGVLADLKMTIDNLSPHPIPLPQGERGHKNLSP